MSHLVKRFHRNKLSCAITVAATIGLMGPATSFAQLEEVIVTAEKREADLQSTAMSIVAMQREELESKGITSIDAAIKEIPGVQINASPQGGVGGSIFIRGVGGNFIDPQLSAQPSVAVNVNGVINSSLNAVQSSMFDVERVEVLRGPQGTLYGSGAQAGVVNIVLAEPKNEFEARGRIQVGNNDTRNVEGVINLPLIDELLAVRLTASNSEKDGYLNGPGAWVTPYDCAVVTDPNAPFPLRDPDACTGSGTVEDPYQKVAFKAENYGASENTVYRVKAKYTPNDWLSILGTYEATDSFSINSPRVPRANWDAGDELLVSGNLSTGVKADTYINEIDLYQLDIVADIGEFATLTFRPARREQSPVSTVANVPSLNSVQDTFELLLSSQSTSELTWTLGAYSRDLKQETSGIGTVTAPIDDGRYAVRNLDRPFDEQNFFGEVTVPVTDLLRVTAGGRYTSNTNSFRYQLYNTPGVAVGSDVSVADITDGGVFINDEKQTGFTYKLGFEYDLAEESLLYATVSSGFKAGGLGFQDNTVIIYDPSDVILKPYNEEYSTTFEIGSKNRFLDNTLQVNGSIYYTQWDDMQLQSFSCPASEPNCDPTLPGALTLNVNNADTSDKYGLEIDADWLVTDVDRINASLSAQKGEYGELEVSFFGQTQVLTGHEMSNTPSIAGKIGYQRTFPLSNQSSLVAKIDQSYSASYFNTQEFWLPGAEVDSYWKTDLSLTLETPNWTVNAYARNITDEIQNQFAHPQGYAPSEPKSYGVGVTLVY